MAASPLPFEALPEAQPFDVVMSMGVLYHRRDPLAHLSALAAQLAPGGQLVLETLVIPGDAQQVLVPPDRYARMRNVWFLPSVSALQRWLDRLGFQSHCASLKATTPEEQRTTPWMPFESLREALAPEDESLTVEGLPAPHGPFWSAKRELAGNDPIYLSWEGGSHPPHGRGLPEPSQPLHASGGARPSDGPGVFEIRDRLEGCQALFVRLPRTPDGLVRYALASSLAGLDQEGIQTLIAQRERNGLPSPQVSW